MLKNKQRKIMKIYYFINKMIQNISRIQIVILIFRLFNKKVMNN